MQPKNFEQKIQNITIALAGMFQAGALIRDLAKVGEIDELAFLTSINSIYKINAANITDVYAGTQGLKLGFKEIVKLFGNDRLKSDPSISRYVVSIIHLERKLIKKENIRKTLIKRLQHAVSQAQYFSPTHPSVIASLADIYLNTLGTLQFRIQVLGQGKFLNREDVINKIRAVLLAGVRSAVLWRQMGGSRWQLFLWRSKIAKAARQFLNNHA